VAPPNDGPQQTTTTPAIETAPASVGAPVVVRAMVARRPSFIVAALQGLVCVALGVLALRWGLHHAAYERLGALLFAAGLVTAVAAMGRRVVPISKMHEVQAGRAGISLDGVPFASHERIQSAVANLDRLGANVKVDLGNRGDVTLSLADVTWARAIVEALGFDAKRTTATFRAASRANESRITGIGMLAGALIFGLVCWNPFYGAACAIVLFLGGLAMPTMVTVGTDGVLVRWAFENNYFPYADITRVDRMPGRVRLHLRSGKSFDVVFRGGNDRDVPAAGQLAERIVEAIERRDHGGASLDAAMLARPHGVDTHAWVASLREILRDETFRQAAVTVDQLWSVVEDATAKAATRAAAAIALRGVVDEKGKRRLRVAAQATAAPQLRVALERAADGEDAEVAAALEELDRSTNA
jgi:hypothetical protein